MPINYSINESLTAEEVADVFRSSGIKRPAGDLARIQTMIDHADVTVAAREGGRLIGVARALTDFSYCCYLSDLAVRAEHQKQGIGKQLVRLLQGHLGETVSIVLLSAPVALDYYPRIGFEHSDRAFVMPRVK